MAYPDRVTVCVSTQAGCAMACPFCATGQGGFNRHLHRRRDRRAGGVGHAGAPGHPRRVHGHGRAAGQLRPDAWRAVRRLHDDMGISARRLTVSTVGIVPGIRRLAAEGLPVNLAVSLHAANDELRDELVPINRRYPLAVLAEACADYVERDRAAAVARVGGDRRGERPPRRTPTELADVRPPARRAREPHPAQRDRRLPGPAAGPGRAEFRSLPRPARRERDGAGHPGRGDRGGLRPAGRHGRAAASSGARPSRAGPCRRGRRRGGRAPARPGCCA